MKLRRLLSGIISISAISLNAQTAVIKGKVTDKLNGEAIIGAPVFIEGSSMGTSTDLAGTFELRVNPGTYKVVCKFVSYEEQMHKITVSEFGITINFELLSKENSLRAIEVQASQIRNTEASLINLQRQSIRIQDGVSAAQISQTGAGNAAESMRQMVGANVEDGKYVVMRGLGDRYSITQLNGLPLPGTDPYRNSSSLDLIPASFIENLITLKTFTPDQPGNFTGGNVEISTKTVPDSVDIIYSVSTAYNTEASLRDDFLTSEKDSYEWLGFYGRKRALPSKLADTEFRNSLLPNQYITVRNRNSREQERSNFQQSGELLNKQFIPSETRSPLNQRHDFAFGNKYRVFKKEVGLQVGARYSINFQHYDDGQIRTLLNNLQPELFAYQDLLETRSVINPQLGAFANLHININSNNQIGISSLFSNDAEHIARRQSGKFAGQVSNSLATFHTHSIQFIQRQINSLQLNGSHLLSGLPGAKLSWTANRVKLRQDEPDMKYFAYTSVRDQFARSNAEGDLYYEYATEYYLNNAEYARPFHFFRYLDDVQQQGRIDLTIPFRNDIKITVGGFASSLARNFREYRFEVSDNGIPSHLRFTEFLNNNNNELSQVFRQENFGIVDTLYNASGEVTRYVTGYHYVNQTNPKNFYQGNQTVYATYLMGELNLAPGLTLAGGARYEITDIHVATEDTSKIIIGKNLVASSADIFQKDILPSINLVYELTSKMKVRLSGSKTLARPNLREISPFVQFDTKNGFFTLGNPSLKRSLIQNYDFRWEHYSNPGEIIALGVFAKIFDQPIVQAFNNNTIPEMIFINVNRAEVYGVEAEMRRKLDFIAKGLKFSANVSYIYSQVDMPEEEIKTSQQFDPSFNSKRRPFSGQSPTILNCILSYQNPTSGTEAALSVNVSGRKLHQIALVATPDIYEAAFPLLNFRASQRVTRYLRASVQLQNILDSKFIRTQDYRGKRYVVETYSPGTLVQVGLSYQFRK